MRDKIKNTLNLNIGQADSKNVLMLLAMALVIFTGCGPTIQSVRPDRRDSSSLARTTSSAWLPDYHVVSKGDTLWSISKRYGIALEDLLEANDAGKNSIIMPGQRLMLAYSPGAKRRAFNRSDDHKKGLIRFYWPLQGKIVHRFGEKVDGVPNKGIVIRASSGSDVRSSQSGVVAYVDEKMIGLGKVIIIEHDKDFSTVYGYNSDNMVVIGQEISKGEVIARVGSSGRARVSQLHFEIRRGSKSVNPLLYLK